MFSQVGPGQLLIILLLVLILFGAGKLPDVLKQLGKGMKAFKEAQREDPLDVTPGRKELAADDPVSDADEVKPKVTTRNG